MKFKKEIIILIKGTVLSILVFFSVSFLMVLYRISPVTMGNTYDLQIGFPFLYYEQFQARGNPFLNSTWGPMYLLIDCFIFWVLTTGIYVMVKRKK